MQRVFPGSLETLARPFLNVNMLMSDDLPTLDRPMTANSGNLGGGQDLRETALDTYLAVLMRECCGVGRLSWISGNSSRCGRPDVVGSSDSLLTFSGLARPPAAVSGATGLATRPITLSSSVMDDAAYTAKFLRHGA